MNKLVVTSVRVGAHRIDVGYYVEGLWSDFFAGDNFYVEFEEEITGISESIAIVPFLGNILPISWYFDGTIEVPEIDKAFFECLENVKKGYIDMYPSVNFGGQLISKRICCNSVSDGRSAVFFSGGVDANYTFLRHVKEKPALITVWGADIKENDVAGWKIVDCNTRRVAAEYELDYYMIKSNFRTMLNIKNLNAALSNKQWSWWHEFQHGMGIITLSAPLAYVKGISKLYIAASYTDKTKDYTCASDPTIDNYIKFCDCSVVHDGYSANRQEKIAYIVRYSNENAVKIPLRVCWVHEGGDNCCVCEKCCRTMTEIYLEDAEPSNFGFEIENQIGFDKIGHNLKTKIQIGYAAIPLWEEIHQDFQRKFGDSWPKGWKWFKKGGVKSINHNPTFVLKKSLLRIGRIVTRKSK